MLSITIRTDKPEAELSLYENTTLLAHESWQAHRQLGETVHRAMQRLLEGQQKTFEDLEGIICFKGPGSFTGLRIGLTVANAFADSLKIPIVGEMGEGWEAHGIARLHGRQTDSLVLPEYGADVHITLPKH